MDKECNTSMAQLGTLNNTQPVSPNSETPQIITIVDLGINVERGFAGTGDDGCPQLNCCPGHCPKW